MKKEFQNSKRRLILGTLLTLFIIAIAFLFLFFRNFIKSELDETAMRSSNELATQLQILINMDFINAKNSVISLAESVTTLEYEESIILDYLQSQMSMHSFINMYYVRMNGDALTPSNEIKNFSNSSHFNNPVKNTVNTSDPYIDSNTQNIILELSSPIYYNNQMIGLILVEYSFAPLSQQLTKLIGENGYMLIADGKGAPVFSTKINYTTLNMLSNANLKDGITLESVSQDILNRDEGSFSFKYDSLSWLAIYKPLDVYNWYIVLLLDESKIAVTSNLVVNLTSLLSFIIFVVLVGALWYTLHTKVQNTENIERIAYYDELTGLPNITKFKMHVLETLKKYPTEQFALVKNDIVNFKTINEMYGYDVGNDVLHAFAATSNLATEPTFMLARIDADRFIMFSGGGFLENMDSMTPYYEEYFKNAVPSLGNHHLEFTYGRYIIKPGEIDINDMINKTNIAHSLAKKNRGQNSSTLIWDYTDKYKEEILLQTLITNKMKQALENDEFILYLQPKFSLKNEKTVGAEALVRWIEGDGTMVYPGIFIPLFEKNGFVKNIDMCILNKTCENIKNWLELGYECVPISVNFSRLHLKNSNFVNSVIDIVDSYGIPHNLIEIELTESTVIDNAVVLETLLDDFYSAGFLVSIDDFGAGYSSLGLLKNFKLHTIKLDRSFFLDSQNERGDLVIEGMIQLAHTLGIKVVAEGIEEKRQIDFLKKVNCEAVQGYYFDKPMPANEFAKKYYTEKN